MQVSLRATTNRLSYSTARQLLLCAGLGVLLLTATVMYARRVETVEVLGTLLYIPILICSFFWGVRGGVVAGVMAAGAYAFLRNPAIDAVGFDPFVGVLASRTLAFVAFGAIGGWANRQLESSLTKLERFDQIDDRTGLFNARFFLENTDMEAARARRYRSMFSVAVVDVPISAVGSLSARRREKFLRALGETMRESVRVVDHPVYALGASAHRFAVVLPETGPEGAAIFVGRLATRMAEQVARAGGTVGPRGLPTTRTTSWGDDDAVLRSLQAQFSAIARREFPMAEVAA
ncbi:MAG: GGDEF domain-containing protein [Actinomycetota bacterium]